MSVRHALSPLILLAVLALVANADDQEKTLFTEAFTDKLADGWTWVREDPKGWRLDKGTLIVRTSTGGLWQKENDGGNILLRTPPKLQDGKLAAEVLVDIEPTNLFENAGLIWYYDDDNYVIMVKEKIGNEIHMQFVAEKDGNLAAGFHKTFNEAKSVWFRMVVDKEKVTGSYRVSPREEWVTVGQCSLPVRGEPKVGLTTAYAPKDAEHFTRFSSFRLLQIK
jgi:regulation of enolase protein 1 (concanavalin A-like superfamily)